MTISNETKEVLKKLIKEVEKIFEDKKNWAERIIKERKDKNDKTKSR